MPRAAWCRDEIYDFFDRWRRSCLIDDKAVFSDDAIWTAENLRRLQTTLGAELLGNGTFFEKLRTQLESHEPGVRQLGVEIVYVEYLGERDTSGATKRTNIGDLLDLLPDGVTMPESLSEILDGGIASYGPGKAYRDAYVRFLLKLARRAKEDVHASGTESLDDPWRLRDAVAAVRTSTDGLEANAVLHGCFPDQFDVMISKGHREKLLRRFAHAPLVAAAEDEDLKLLAVREVLRTSVPVPIDEPYDDAVRPVWDEPASAEWDELTAAVATALPATDDQSVAAPEDLPDADVDLLERLQHLLGTTIGWEALLPQAAVRLAAHGADIHSWAQLLEGMRAAIDSIPSVSEDTTDHQEPAAGDGVFALPAVTPELAGELLISQSWLQRLLDELTHRRQLVLYGPPGTGKTWLARRIAVHAFDPDAVRLVQFHPSYTYEDFVEGYRPKGHGGVLTYELVPGPLRDLSARASANPNQPHLLIVDEINRGNLPKIFGELYFLLEYRDEPLRLQYSTDEEFRLPPNLHIIGTMNTADRSIALLDAALRRRFAFLELSPHAEPVEGLLQRWLDKHKLDPEPHILLDTLNALLLEADGDRDLAIGPSYFMKGMTPDLEAIWEYDILPLLAERFYGSGLDVPAQFGLDAIRSEATRRADAIDPASSSQ